MKRITHQVGAAALAVAGVAMLSSPVHAQAPAQVTITFRLTINGTPPAVDRFVVSFGQNGVELCGHPCVGGGHTYVQTIPWGKGTGVIHFQVARVTLSSPEATTVIHRDVFGQQTAIPTANRTVSAFFTYASGATLQAPTTGAAPPFPAGAGLVGAGTALLLLSMRRRWFNRTG